MPPGLEEAEGRQRQAGSGRQGLDPEPGRNGGKQQPEDLRLELKVTFVVVGASGNTRANSGNCKVPILGSSFDWTTWQGLCKLSAASLFGPLGMDEK